MFSTCDTLFSMLLLHHDHHSSHHHPYSNSNNNNNNNDTIAADKNVNHIPTKCRSSSQIKVWASQVRPLNNRRHPNLSVWVELEAGSEICQHDVARPVDEHVVGLDVPVDVPEAMQSVDGQHHLGHVELCHLLGQPVLELRQQSQKIPAAVVVHDQILSTMKSMMMIVDAADDDNDVVMWL